MGYGYFQDSKGNKSSMRLMMFILLGYALTFGAVTLFREGSMTSLGYITGVMGLVGTLKLIQNGQEK